MMKNCSCFTCKYFLGRKNFCMAKQVEAKYFNNCCSEYTPKKYDLGLNRF